LSSEFLVVCIAFVATIVFAKLCGRIADAKGLDGYYWALAGVFFGPIALLGVIGMPDKKLQRYLRAIGESKGVDFYKADKKLF
jgi:hypothetical protein